MFSQSVPAAKAGSSLQFFCAVGHNGLRMISHDGIKWTHQQTGKEGETYRAVCGGQGRVVAIGSYGGDNIFASSPDGARWHTSKKDAQYAQYVRGLCFGNGQFLALGGDPLSVGDARPFVITTADGITWSEPARISGKDLLRRVAWGNGRFVAVGDRGRRASSVDGLEWTDAPDVKAIDTLIDIACGGDVFVGVGLHGLRMTSRDGITWSDLQRGAEGEHLNSVFWTGDRFIAVGFGATYSSEDGRTWQRHPNEQAPQTAASGNGMFIGASWRGRLLFSEDAINWRQVHTSEQHVEAVNFVDA